MIGVPAVFAAISLGAALGLRIARRELSLTLSLAGLAACLALFFLLVRGLPFAPFYSAELLATAAGACVVAWPMSGLYRMPKGAGLKTAPRAALVLFFSWLPVAAITMTTLLERFNYAERLRWSCDGAIVEVTRAKANHNLPTLVVSSSDGTRRFERVDGPLWEKARPGARLVKNAGSAFAALDGERLRMVPGSLRWWDDPDAAPGLSPR